MVVWHTDNLIVFLPQSPLKKRDSEGAVTTSPEIETDEATIEPENAEKENVAFINYDKVTRINSTLFDKTGESDSRYSIRLSGAAGEKIGLARSMAVMTGDTIRAKVYGKYLDPEQTNYKQIVLGIVATLASNAMAPGAAVEGSSASNGSSFPFDGLLSKAAVDEGQPQAYLNYLVFDKNMVLIEKKSGYEALTTAAREDGSNRPHEELSTEIIVTEPGYVYIYPEASSGQVLSNDSPMPKDVYFDQFNVEHAHSAIVQSDDYYPFGLSFNQYKAPGKMSNKLLFNDGSRLEEATGLYETYFRNYDPSIGRFNGVDMLAAMTPSLTPYRYGFNNPVSYNDPTGLSERPNACRDCEDGGGGGFFDSSNPFGDGGTSTWDWGGGNNWMNQYSSQNRDYFLMSDPAFEKKWGQGLSNYRNSLILQKAHQTGNATTYINSGYYSYTSINGGKTWQNTGWTGSWTVAQNGVGPGSDTWNAISNFNNGLGFVIGGTLHALGQKLDARLAYEFTEPNYRGWKRQPAKVPPTRFGRIDVPTGVVKNFATGLKVGGATLGFVGLGMTGYEIYTGQKSLVGEGGLDLVMGGVAFIPGGGWIASGAYFGGKALLEYTGNDFWNEP